jgi:hypothetical protein
VSAADVGAHPSSIRLRFLLRGRSQSLPQIEAGSPKLGALRLEHFIRLRMPFDLHFPRGPLSPAGHIRLVGAELEQKRQYGRYLLGKFPGRLGVGNSSVNQRF